MKSLTICIFQYKCKFAFFQLTTCKGFSEVETSLNWSNCKVVKLCICRHSNCSVQKTSLSVFCDVNSHNSVHWIIIDIRICASFFTYSVSMCTCSSVRDCIELDGSIRCILFSLDHIAIFKQFKCEGILRELFPFQFLSELELSLCSNRCEGIVELCICRKCVCCFKNMTLLRNSNGHFRLHCVVSHTSFFIFWDNFFNSVLVSTNLCICECQIIKGYNTCLSISLSLKNSSVGIFQLETEFTIFKSTTCKSFGEVEFSLNRSYNVVVEDLISCA